MEQKEKIGLLGGTFDPIHEGHLHVARLAQKELSLDKVLFIPLNQAVHKEQPHLPLSERLKLIEDLIKNEPTFELYQGEIERGGPSFAIDTVQALLHEGTNCELYYIIGSDAFAEIFSWKEPYKLLKMVNFVIVSRPGYDFSKIEQLFETKENNKYLEKLFFIDDEGIDISSTKVRKMRGIG